MSKSLIIFFSRAGENYAVGTVEKGNTEIAAEFVRDLTGADMFKVEPLVPYADEYAACVRQAKERIGNAPVREPLPDPAPYDTVYVMSPVYFGTFAPEMETVLKNLDLTGKKVRVITTHEGSGLANAVRDAKRICRGAEVDENGLAIRGSRAAESKPDIEAWL